MNHTIISTSRWLLLITAFIAAISEIARAASYSPGDQITLTRDEPMLFRDKVFRQGRTGEEFAVLTHRADIKKVFLSATDQTGRQIAISIPEDAVALAPVDTASLTTRAVEAARAGKFPNALRLMDQAIRSAPTDVALQQTRSAIVELQSSAGKLSQAQAERKKAVAEAARIRRNARVTDRPNRLDPNDTSNQRRAEKMREQATAVEQASLRNLTAAESQLRSVTKRLSGLQSESAPKHSAAAVQNGTQISAAPSASAAPMSQIAGAEKPSLDPPIGKAESPAAKAKQPVTFEQLCTFLGSWNPRVLEHFEFDGLKLGMSLETLKKEHPTGVVMRKETSSEPGIFMGSSKNADLVAISTVDQEVRGISIGWAIGWSLDATHKEDSPSLLMALVLEMHRKPDRVAKNGDWRWIFSDIHRAVECGMTRGGVTISLYDLSEALTLREFQKDDGGAFVKDKDGKSGVVGNPGRKTFSYKTEQLRKILVDEGYVNGTKMYHPDPKQLPALALRNNRIDIEVVAFGNSSIEEVTIGIQFGMKAGESAAEAWAHARDICETLVPKSGEWLMRQSKDLLKDSIGQLPATQKLSDKFANDTGTVSFEFKPDNAGGKISALFVRMLPR